MFVWRDCRVCALGHCMVLALLGGPVIRALADVILMTLVLGVANGQPNVILVTWC